MGEVQSITYRMKQDHLGFLPSSFLAKKSDDITRGGGGTCCQRGRGLKTTDVIDAL